MIQQTITLSILWPPLQTIALALPNSVAAAPVPPDTSIALDTDDGALASVLMELV